MCVKREKKVMREHHSCCKERIGDCIKMIAWKVDGEYHINVFRYYLYFSATTSRFNFIVGVSSPLPMEKSTGSSFHFWII